MNYLQELILLKGQFEGFLFRCECNRYSLHDTEATQWWKTCQNSPISHQTVQFPTNSKTCQMAMFTFSNAMIWQYFHNQTIAYTYQISSWHFDEIFTTVSYIHRYVFIHWVALARGVCWIIHAWNKQIELRLLGGVK